MNKTEINDYQINLLLDELQEAGVSKFCLFDMIGNKNQKDTIEYLKTIKGEVV